MSEKCPTCHQYINEQKPEKELRLAPKGFQDLCFILKQNSLCEEGWKKPLDDFCKRDGLTEGQWKFFAVMHKTVLGRWPDQFYNQLEKKEGLQTQNSSSKSTPAFAVTNPEDDMLF